MREITASYRRVFQVKLYETETIELSVTEDVADDEHAVLAVGNLHRVLSALGDEILADRVAAAKPSDVKRVEKTPW